MKVKEIMNTEPRTCTPDSTIAEAAALMWDADCGILPVVDEGELVGVVTDRDMYIALATQNTRAAQVRIGAVATAPVVTCTPDDEVRTALAVMRRARVRRLPVVGNGKTLIGILSMNDIVRVAGTDDGVPADDVMATLKTICAPHREAAEPAIAVPRPRVAPRRRLAR